MFGETSAQALDEETITDTYVYLLGRALVTRQEHTDLEETGVAYNTIKYNPLGSADFVNPNFDVAYLEAWFAVDDKTPVVLEVPEIEGRYYTAQIMDEWGGPTRCEPGGPRAVRRTSPDPRVHRLRRVGLCRKATRRFRPVRNRRRGSCGPVAGR